MASQFSNNESLERISELLFKELQLTLTHEEKAELEQWKAQYPERLQAIEEITQKENILKGVKQLHEIKEYIDKGLVSAGILDPVIHSRGKVAGLRWASAAAIIIFTCIGAYLWNTMHKEKPAITQAPMADAQKAKQDIPPGGQKAVLTLADGSIINLDTAANGRLATQGSASIIKTSDGRLTYQMSSGPSNSLRAGSGTGPSYPPLAGVSRSDGGGQSTNKMTTPIGGQYQLILPDGTKVWLNAASSITYPVAFTGKQRNVQVTGEVYFEVAANKGKPFIADVDGRSSVEVLGTRFNVNAYVDEPSMRTTLLEGSVKVSRQGRSVLLAPGEQAIIKENIIVNKTVNTERAIAWKNGVFNFEDAPFDEFMRQLARWYDLTVVYKGAVPQKVLRGELQRNLHLSQILKVLSLFEVKYTLTGKTLTIE